MEYLIPLFSVPPRFTRNLEDQYVKENYTAEFSCDVYPIDSKVSWMFHGSDIDPSSLKFETKNNGKTRSLVIREAKEEDAGIVSAISGETDCHAELGVEGTIRFHLICVFLLLPLNHLFFIHHHKNSK